MIKGKKKEKMFRQGKRREDERHSCHSHLGVGGSCGSITFSIVHHSTIGANHTLHRSHLVPWPARGGALGSSRGRKPRNKTVSQSRKWIQKVELVNTNESVVNNKDNQSVDTQSAENLFAPMDNFPFKDPMLFHATQ